MLTQFKLKTLYLTLCAVLLVSQGVSLGNENIPPRPEIPKDWLEDRKAFKSELDELLPEVPPMRRLDIARNKLVALESWRIRFDEDDPVGWRERIKQFSILCDEHDKKLRTLQARNQIDSEALSDWELFVENQAKPIWINSGENMQSYHALMKEFRGATQAWKKIVIKMER